MDPNSAPSANAPKPNLDDLLKSAPKTSVNTPDPQSDPNLSTLEEPEEDISSPQADDINLQQLEKAKQEEAQITSLNDDIDKNNPNLVSGRNKEVFAGSSPETVKFQEVSTEFEPGKETGEFIKKAANEDKIKMPKVVKDDYGDIILKASNAPKPNIVLPVTEEELEKAFHKKVSDSVRWLAEWCKRNILMMPKRVFFNDKNSQEKS